MGDLDFLQDICNAVDNAQNGVIVFSMGTLIDVNLIPQHFWHSLLTAFSRLPQLVIAKLDFGSNSQFKIPDNVMALPYIPQEPILAHPKTVSSLPLGIG